MSEDKGATPKGRVTIIVHGFRVLISKSEAIQLYEQLSKIIKDLNNDRKIR